jgi:hypothetical protein
MPAIFLSSQAASFCTGVDLIVDGGFVCRRGAIKDDVCLIAMEVDHLMKG